MPPLKTSLQASFQHALDQQEFDSLRLAQTLGIVLAYIGHL